MTLTPMTAQDLTRLLVPLEAEYAAVPGRAPGVDPGGGLDRRVSQDARESLPAGAATEGALLRLGRVGDTEVGWIWVTLPTAGRPEATAWIQQHRGASERTGGGGTHAG